ncbi:MAG: PDC sensor domain-containing protein [Pseudomonadota bacterium]
MRKILLASAFIATSALHPAHASDYDDALRDVLQSDLASFLADPMLVAAIREQNATTGAYDDGKINALDQQWRGEVGDADAPLITSVLDRSASQMLKLARDEAGGLITEIFVMDAKGLNVAASDITSDYWQGDEAKWQQTYAIGPDAVHISDVELDESTQEYQAQISVSVADPDTGQPIGAATIGVNVGLLE